MRRERAVKVGRARELRAAMTPAERRLWRVLRAGALDSLRFRRQHPIRGFIVDFYCAEFKLAVEVDGSVHELRRDCDAERDRILTGEGVMTLRFSNEDVLTRLSTVVSSILFHAKPRP